MATVTGWGRLKYGGGVPSILQEVQVPIMENHVCQEMFRTAGHSKVILESFLCAGYANGQKDSCEVSDFWILYKKPSDSTCTCLGRLRRTFGAAAPRWSLPTCWDSFAWNKMCGALFAGCLYAYCVLQTVDRIHHWGPLIIINSHHHTLFFYKPLVSM